MTTENKPLATIPIDARRPKNAAHRPGRRPTNVFRIALPLVYAGLGIALGSLTGLTVAFMTVPVDASVASSDSTDSASATPASATSAPQTDAAKPNVMYAVQPAPTVHPAAVVRVAENKGSLGSDAAQARSHAATAAPAKSTMKNESSNETPIEPSRVPAAEKEMNQPAVPNEARPHRQVAHPVAVQPRKVLASEPEVVPVVMDDEQIASASVDEPKPANTYSEGDLTVADYNATAGTIQTSDGRTFVLGTTVSASSATSWDDYHSSVHYRCDQEGSCTLERAGAIAPNAKVI
jgi:hypothetical protein